MGFPGAPSGKESAGDIGSFNPWVGKIPWRKKWQPTPVFLPGRSHGQRSLAGCSPGGQKESDMTGRLSTVESSNWTGLEDRMIHRAPWTLQTPATHVAIPP